MLFATSTVAARIERAEAAVVRDFAERARAAGKDVLIEPVGGTHAVFGGPGEPFNKVVGLGLNGAVDEEALARLEAAYDGRHAEIRVEQCTLADPSVAVLLTRRGYELIGYENVLGLGLTSAIADDLSRSVQEDATRGITIERARPDQMQVWIETAIDGFVAPDQFDGPPPTETFDRETLRGVYADYNAAPGTVMYFASREGTIAGVGSTRADGGLALMSGAATLPAHRRRGVQSALLRARLLDVATAGCDLAVVTTEPASKSQQNVQRAGFQLLYARAILLRRARAADE